MLLSFAFVSGILFQVQVALSVSNIVTRENQTDPLSVVDGRRNWRRLLYLLPCTVIPGLISYATAGSKYRFAGPLSAAMGAAIMTRRLNKADRGHFHPFWTHNAWVTVSTSLLALVHIYSQVGPQYYFKGDKIFELSLIETFRYYFTGNKPKFL